MENTLSHKKMFKVLLFISVVVFFSVLFTLPQILRVKNGGNEGGTNGGANNGSTSVSEKLPEKPEALYSSNVPLDILTEYKKSLKFNEGDYWENWSWQNKMIQLTVGNVNAEDRYMVAAIKLPKNGEVSNEATVVHIRCPSEKTVAVAYDKPTAGDLAADFDIYSRAAAGDLIYTFCEDAECLNLGRGCLLVDFDY